MFPIRDTEPSRRAPVAVFWLIGLNVAVFLFQTLLDQQSLGSFVEHFGLVPAAIPAGSPWQHPLALLPLVTSQFLHGGLLHILGNLWMLWIFGDNVEDRMGAKRFLAFYLVCGIIAGWVHVLSAPTSAVPTIGASGAIAGVMGAYLVWFPQARVIVLVPILFYPLFFQIRAVAFLGLWFLIQYISSLSEHLMGGEEVGGVAYWAHIGGFLSGMALCWVFRKPRPERRRLYSDEWGPEQAWRGSKRSPWS